MLRPRVAVILIVTTACLGCDAIAKAIRDQAYEHALSMGGLDDTSLTIPRTASNGYPAISANPFAFRRLVLRHEYATLDSILTAAAESAHADYRNESYLFGAYDAMQGDTALAEPLARWSHERPTSAPAYLARASYLTGQAWTARGTAYGAYTPQKRFDRMNALFAQAKPCVDTALTLSPRSAEAYLLLLSITKSSSDTALWHTYVTKGLEDIPASFWLRRRYMRNITPRWGGSYDLMRAFAEASQAMADTNPRLRALLGYVELDSAELYEEGRQEGEALNAYNHVLTYGDESQFHLERGEMLLRSGREQDAFPDLDFAVASNPGGAEGYVWRGMAREALWAHSGRTKRDLAVSALSDYQHAVVLDAADDLAVGRFVRLYRIVH